MLHAIIVYTSSSKDFHILLELVWKNTPCLKTTLENDLLQKRQGIYTLPHEKSLSSEEIMVNFLTCSVQINVQNVT